jgi:hypothetical protein
MTKNKINYTIKSVSEDKFEIDKDAFKEAFPIEINSSIEFQYNPVGRSFKIAVSHELSKKEESIIPILEVSVNMVFELEEESLKEYTIDDVLIIPESFRSMAITTINGIIQGIIVARMKDLGKAPVILPPVDIAALDLKPFIINLNGNN